MMVDEKDLLNKMVRRITEKYPTKAIILFGSRARGNYKPWSDYDLLIIADFKEKYLDRIKSILDLIADIPLPIEPHPYTLEEAINMLKKGNPIIVDALEEGIKLYTSSQYNVLQKLYEELKKKGLKKSETTIILPGDEV